MEKQKVYVIIRSWWEDHDVDVELASTLNKAVDTANDLVKELLDWDYVVSEDSQEDNDPYFHGMEFKEYNHKYEDYYRCNISIEEKEIV